MAYQITLSKAKGWTTAWKENFPDMVKAFRIEVDEINQILATPNIAYVRAYMGYDEDTKMEKLMLVPVDANNKDLINDNPSSDSCVYDFTLPCPSTCDLDSPLN